MKIKNLSGSHALRRTLFVAAAGLSFVVASSAAWAQGAPPPAPPPPAPPAAAPPPPAPPFAAQPPPQGQPPPYPGYPPDDPRYQAPYPYPYPYPYYPPPYGYRAPADVRPEVIDYEEGKTIPPGYTRTQRKRKKLVVAGAVLFATAYGLSLMGATTSALEGEDRFAPMFVPVFGPFITMGTAADDMPGGLRFIFLLDGMTQLAGATLLITGIVWKEDVLLRDDTIEKEALVPELLVGPGSAGIRMRF